MKMIYRPPRKKREEYTSTTYVTKKRRAGLTNFNMRWRHPDYGRKEVGKVIKAFWRLMSVSMIRENKIITIPDFGKLFIIQSGRSRRTFFLPSGTLIEFLTPTFRHHFQKFNFLYNTRFYVFCPVAGNGRDVGRTGLRQWIKKCSKDPYLKDYRAIRFT